MALKLLIIVLSFGMYLLNVWTERGRVESGLMKRQLGQTSRLDICNYFYFEALITQKIEVTFLKVDEIDKKKLGQTSRARHLQLILFRSVNNKEWSDLSKNWWDWLERIRADILDILDIYILGKIEVDQEKNPDQKKVIFRRGATFRTSCAFKRVNLKTKATH